MTRIPAKDLIDVAEVAKRCWLKTRKLACTWLFKGHQWS